MNRPIRTALGVAAGLALALVALPAHADHERGDDHDRGYDHDRDRGHERHGIPAPAAYPLPYAYVPAVPAPVVHQPYRHARWRGWEARELRREYVRLDLARDRFYVTWDGNPWSRNRFESWYGARRAELDRRWSELGRW